MSDFNPSGKDQKSTSLILSGIKYPFDTYLAVKFDLRWKKPHKKPGARALFAQSSKEVLCSSWPDSSAIHGSCFIPVARSLCDVYVLIYRYYPHVFL